VLSLQSGYPGKTEDRLELNNKYFLKFFNFSLGLLSQSEETKEINA
jgi:hypothetical protein